MFSIRNLIYSKPRKGSTLHDAVQIFEEVGKRQVAQETKGNLCLEGTSSLLDDLGQDDPVDVPFPQQIGAPFECIQPALLALLLTEVVEHELEVLAGGAEHDLVLATVELVVIYLYELVVDEDIAIDDVEHVPQVYVLVFGEDQPHWVKVVDVAVLLNYETSLD